jgi:iron complex outermembrane receptor protein
MQTWPKFKQLRAGVAPLALAAALIPSAVFAQAAPAASQSPPPTPATAAPAAEDTNTIVVTGSLIRRTNTETSSPTDVLSGTAIETAGYDSVAAALTNLTANGAGTLSANNSVAFAGGASGIALRGLSVGATLTLVDGHRLAPYPLSDDGERQFTDIQSIPLGAIDSIEVDKDGASSIYGSEAIAGVVNLKLKKQITGIEASGEVGTSQHGGGFSKRYDFSAGYGDLSTDGYNAFITIEYRTQDEIDLTQRQYQSWASENFTSIGGNDLRPGSTGFAILNGGYALTRTPFLVTPTGGQIFLGSGCNPTSYAANQCAYIQQQQLLAPTQKFSALAGFTKEFEGGWEAKLKLSFFDSQGRQQDGGPVIFGANSYPGASFGGNPGLPAGIPGVGAIANYTLPANYLGTGSPAGSFLEGVIPGIGLPTNLIDSKTYRAALDVTGKIGTWDVTGSLGYSRVNTHTTFENYVNYDTLYNDLTTFNAAGQPLFNPAGGNSYAEIQNVAPTLGFTASDTLYYAEADATGKLLDLPGGDLSMAFGATVIQKDLDNPASPPCWRGSGAISRITPSLSRPMPSARKPMSPNSWNSKPISGTPSISTPPRAMTGIIPTAIR